MNITGKIDLLEYLNDDSFRVTDFKTGLAKTKNVIEKIENGRMSSYLRQLAMYSYLLAGEEGPREVAESRLLFLEENLKNKNSFYSTKINQEEIDLLIKDIKDYDEALKNGNWADISCNYKGYGQNSDCPYCVLKSQLLRILGA